MSDWTFLYQNKQRGASLLLELCMGTACLCFLAFCLMPGLSGISSRHQAVQLMEHLSQSIQLAKNEALARQRYMVLCGSVDGKTCAPQKHWGPYWLIGEARLGQSALSRIQLSKVLRVYSITPPHTLELGEFPAGTPHYLSIRPNGQTYNNATFTYHYLERGKSKEMKLRVNQLLRTYITLPSDCSPPSPKLGEGYNG
jgi:hypothetical protein